MWERFEGIVLDVGFAAQHLHVCCGRIGEVDLLIVSDVIEEMTHGRLARGCDGNATFLGV